MAEWRTALCSKSEEPKRLTYMLEQKFSEIDVLNLASLSGRDQLRVQYLYNAAKAHDISIYLAHFEHTQYGECDPGEYDDDEDIPIHDFIGDFTSRWRLSTLYTLEGIRLGSGYPLCGNDFIGDVSFDDEEPDEENDQGWDYHDKCYYAAHFFRRSCVLLLPHEERGKFVDQGTYVAADEWAKIILSELDGSASQSTDDAVRELAGISRSATKSSAPSPYMQAGSRYAKPYSTSSELFLDLAVRFANPEMLRGAAAAGFEVDTFRKLGQAWPGLHDDEWLDALVFLCSCL